MKIRRSLLAVAVMFCAAADIVAQNNDHNFNVAKNIDLFTAIYKNLDMLYVDSLDANKVIGEGIDAMLASLDRYTEYYRPEDTNDLKFKLTGKYAGIGSTIKYNYKEGCACIDEPYFGMPAQEAGLRKGDIIVSIDDSLMKGKEVSYVSERLRGDAGTSFVLKVHRPSTDKDMVFKITRRLIQTPAVPYYGLIADGVGFISLTTFSENCGQLVRNAVIDLKRQGMKSLVLDLRSNGGGSEVEAVNVVNVFVPKGRFVVSNRGKAEHVSRNFSTQVEPVDTLLPLVVLVNGTTASASEIVSGALQDMDRAVIMGTRTYGKGIVQTMLELPYNAQMKLTTNKYYIPSGRCIQARNFRKTDSVKEELVADSLAKVFLTANGRKVKDAGGIQPDVEVPADSLPNIVYYLAYMRDSSEVMHSYIVDYIDRHPTIAPAADFELTDADYEDFRKMVVESGFKHDPLSNDVYEELVKVAKYEGYYDDAKAEFEALKAKLRHDVGKDLDKVKDVVKQLVASEIVTAYYYQAGQVRNTLRHDKFFKEACRLLAKPEEYNALLSGEEK